MTGVTQGDVQGVKPTFQQAEFCESTNFSAFGQAQYFSEIAQSGKVRPAKRLNHFQLSSGKMEKVLEANVHLEGADLAIILRQLIENSGVGAQNSEKAEGTLLSAPLLFSRHGFIEGASLNSFSSRDKMQWRRLEQRKACSVCWNLQFAYIE